MEQAGCWTRPGLLVCGGAPAGIEPATPSLPSMRGGGSRRRSEPHVPPHPRRWKVLPTVVSWGVARLRVARFLANLWHAEQRTGATADTGQLARARAAG